jgi:pimeloyl-ACP methyl ester carboxylesterase
VYNITYDTTLHFMLGPPKYGPAQAVLKAGGSVELAFNPLVDHGAFRLTGVVRGDSIVGSWHRTSFANDGYRGSFTMVRRVATVPVPPEFRRRLRERTAYTTSRDGVRIAYEVHGKGTTALVFVHGWSCDRTYWAGQLDHFSRRFKVVAVDVAGHGESGLGRKAWTMASFGDDVAAVVKKLGPTRVILIGHSMGGDVIAEAARRLPGRVAGLVWVDAYKQLGTGRTPEQVEAIVAPLRADFVPATRALVRSMFRPAADSMLVKRVATDMSSAPPTVALGALESALSYSREMRRALHELELPVIAINPDNAPTDTSSMQRSGVEVILMPGVGHFLMMEDPERFNGLLGTAIGKLVR